MTAQNKGFNYKALVTDNNGNPLSSQQIDVRFTIIENATTSVYEETHTVTTDESGIFTANVGEGTVITGDFSTINWENEQYLKVEINSGSGYVDFGTTAFKYVPYAKYADKAGNTFSGDFNDLTNVPAGLANGDDDTHLTEAEVDTYVSNNGYLTTEVDGDSTNELQTLNLNGNQLSITNGNTVSFSSWDTDTSDDFSGNYTDLNGAPNLFYKISSTNSLATNNTDYMFHIAPIDIGGYDSTGAYISAINGETQYEFGTAFKAMIYAHPGINNNIIGLDNNLNLDVNSPNGSVTGVKNYIHSSNLGYGLYNEIIGFSYSENTLYGSYTKLNDTYGSSKLTGSFAKIEGNTSNNVYGTVDSLLTTGSGQKIGNLNHIFLDNTISYGTENYGTLNSIDDNGAAFAIGTSNELRVSNTTGRKFGTINYFVMSQNNAEIFGVYNNIGGENNSVVYGTYNDIHVTNGTGVSYGTYNDFSNDYTYTKKIAVYNDLFTTSDQLLAANYSKLLNNGNGDVYGDYVNIYGSGNGKSYGYIDSLSGNTDMYGVYNYLSGSGKMTGIYTYLDNPSSSNMHYCVENNVQNAEGVVCGTYTEMLGGKTMQCGNKNYIVDDASSSGFQYGTFNQLDGQGSGNKYGTYNSISETAGGTHYAVFGSALKSGSYAGYFGGDVLITRKLKNEDAGNANMMAYIYGKIYSGGSKDASASSEGYNISKIATGHYRITFDSSPGSAHAYMAVASMYSVPGFILAFNSDDYFDVYTYDTSGTAADRDFNFVVYKK